MLAIIIITKAADNSIYSFLFLLNLFLKRYFGCYTVHHQRANSKEMSS